MCGVLGLICENERTDLGTIAGELLKTLEYRGYDSTGAAFQGSGLEVDLRKGVGAPSQLVHSLGILGCGGQIFCGQVRWATFGAVTTANAQPHVVRCKTFLYGAHNGNVTNCDAIKAWLVSQGHQVLSDNDGEMVVHTVEHFFERELSLLPESTRLDGEVRRRCMRAAIATAATRLEGSFSAVVVDPITRVLYAVKLGSSLYFGLGRDEIGGRFGLVSSDLSSILKLTRTIVPLSEGELIEFSPEGYTLFSVGRKEAKLSRIEREPLESKLRAEEIALNPPFTTFMEQEIDAQEATVRGVVQHFLGKGIAPGEEGEQREFAQAVDRFTELCVQTLGRGSRIFVLCCGTSFHAAKAGALFFNELAHMELVPLLPGEFRAQYNRSLMDGDVILSLSQSGETKDLIDALNEVIASGKAIARVAVVNNVNSTIAQEKSQLVIPLHCGPEIAVPATKSFINQVAIFYGLALKVAQRRLEAATFEPAEAVAIERELTTRWEKLPQLPSLIRATLDTTREPISRAAKLLYLRPSIHLLATRMVAVAKEGALKIREVVLNHSEGFECSEFKHGPNTLLGYNTVWGPEQVGGLFARLGEALTATLQARLSQGASPETLLSLVRHATATLLDPTRDGLPERGALLTGMKAAYPLLYITGPEERDVALTVSAINTHKIRGSDTVVIAEENARLRATAEKPPADAVDYHSIYIPLPATGDTQMVVFTSTVVLQRLALEMSLLKLDTLDRLGVEGHGVHPDVPKNVSKSITVD